MKHATSPDSPIRTIATMLVGLLLAACAHAQRTPPVWSPNVDDTTYRNPIIFADYSDPDVVRVGDDFYMNDGVEHPRGGHNGHLLFGQLYDREPGMIRDIAGR